ncbi:phospholipase A2 inhibitor and Ly6/PLAUR domain-containing protein-like [Trachinotus anak]|uniref:phospholipase A2 inhibitor and Ly6/PLAUR domain-containing protein-like n=1 Tax=Trachinotus anak TaxID=443729 RepID=UPI0039F1C20E
MMKLILSLTLIWALCSTAAALMCQTCTDLQCSSTTSVTCSSETACISASIDAVLFQNPGQVIFKGCALRSLCPTPGSRTFSVNFGGLRAVASAECCTADNCNSATLPFPADQSTNTLSCLTCDPATSQCTNRLQCSGVEDQCFQASVMSGSTNIAAFGCASRNLCAAAAGLADLPFLQNIGNITSGPACCGTSMCNTVATTNAASDARCIQLGVIHLLLGLLVFSLY